MLKIFNKIELKEKRKILYTLSDIPGIGYYQALNLCKKMNVNPNLNWEHLNSNLKEEFIQNIETNPNWGPNIFNIEKQNIETNITIASLRGIRHKMALPVRGQRTHSNGKTQKRKSKKIK